jgi:hypothetical protein
MYIFDKTNYCTPIGDIENLIYTDCAYTIYFCISLPFLLYCYYVFIEGLSEKEFYKDVRAFFSKEEDYESYEDFGLKPIRKVMSYGNLPETSIKEFQKNLRIYLKQKKLYELENEWHLVNNE